ncbi:MAG: GntR family transcriptional regulator [Firmicutes bacterium]|nr:GntR family transcriptional regulator [Bacillota bacterium]
MSLEKIEHKGLNERVYSRIKEAIINGNLKSGTKINLNELAEKFGTSKTPIRQALNRLSYEGITEVIPRSGTYVKEYTVEDIEKIFQIRSALEELAIGLVIKRITANNIKKLKEINLICEEMYNKGKLKEFVTTDDKFHFYLLNLSNNEYILPTYQTIQDKLHYFKISGLEISCAIDSAIKYHDKIIDSLEKKDADLAEQYIKEHIEETFKNTVKFISQKQEGKKNA